MQNRPGRELTFVSNKLPWILAAAALVAYLLTLNHWMALIGLPQVARVSGWLWTPDLNGPVLYLVTYPLRWLPPGGIPLALNLFSLVCAALTVYQLARSVALLPQDRTIEQRLREHSPFSTLSIPLAWLPPVFAVIVCAFQLTFWEHATNGTGEMFDLLLFAYVIRSVLEYRVNERESQLFRAALVYGLGMTNNFAMVGFFPLFVAAIIWIRGVSFFHLSFVGRMALWGLAGLSLYLLLPVLAQFNDAEPMGFWLALKYDLGAQKNILTLFPKKTAGLLCLTSLLPVFVMSVRWSSYFGDTSKLGAGLAKLMFHIVHAFFLLACLWTTFDPQFSPRHKGWGLPFLTFYYLGALSVGYFSGYFLLVFQHRMVRGLNRPIGSKLVDRLATGLIIVLLALVAGGLTYKNLPRIRAENGPVLGQFAAAQTEGLSGGGAILSDDVRRLLIAQAWLARDGRDKQYLFLDTQSLKQPGYHQYLHNKYPQKWEAPPKDHPFQTYHAPFLLSRIVTLATNTDLYYLHPSFGYYFEVFCPKPRGLFFSLKRYEAGTLLPEELTPEIISQNESFWAKTESETLKSIASASSPALRGKPSRLERLFETCGILPEGNAQDAVLGSYYSRSLNFWGVEMQKAGQLEKAASHFDLAQQLNPENVVAQVNLEFNKNLQSGNSNAVTLSKSIEDMLGKYRSWEQVVNANGPYDEPALCNAQAWIFMQTQLYRQAAQNYQRVLDFMPDNLPSLFALAQINLMANLPDTTLALITEARSQPRRFNLNSTNLADLAAVEASAWFAKKQPEKAAELITTEIQRNPTDTHLLANMISVYTQRGDFTNALSIVERWLKLNPDNVATLVNKAYICILMRDFDTAIATLGHALEIDPGNEPATLNRAIAFLRSGRLDEAKKDYEALEIIHPNQFQIQYGLGEIAWQQKDTNTAVRHYQTYITNAPAVSAEAVFVADRLTKLTGEKPK